MRGVIIKVRVSSSTPFPRDILITL